MARKVLAGLGSSLVVLVFLAGMASHCEEVTSRADKTHSDEGAVIRSRKTFPMRALIGLGPLPLELEIETGTGFRQQTITIRATLQDSEDSVVDSRSFTLEAGPGKTYPISFLLVPPGFGYFSAIVTVAGDAGKDIARFSTGYGVLRPLTSRQESQDPLNSIFGVNLHWDHDQGDLEVMPQLLHMAGVRWVRDTNYWTTVEQKRGQMAIKPYLRSAYSLLLKRYGIRTLNILCYANKAIYPHATQEEVEKYGIYAEFVARELAGVVDHFEIWNEPQAFYPLTPEQYVPILKAGYDGVKKGNPKAFVVGIGGASPGGWSGDYIPEIRKQKAAGYMDSFSVHPYTPPFTCDLGYVTTGAPAPLSNLEGGTIFTSGFAEDIRQAHNLPKAPRIWATESGWPSNMTGIKGQAQQIARAFLVAASLPDMYERIFIYDFLCDGVDPGGNESNFGLVGQDYSIRPSYVALAAVSRAIEGRPFIRRISHPDESVRLYLFGPESDPLLAGWVTEASPSEMLAGKTRDGCDASTLGKAGTRLDLKRSVKVRISAKSVEMLDWQDRASKLAANDGILNLELSTWPVYVRNLGSTKRIAVVAQRPDDSMTKRRPAKCIE